MTRFFLGLTKSPNNQHFKRLGLSLDFPYKVEHRVLIDYQISVAYLIGMALELPDD